VRCLDDDIVLGLIEGRLAPPILADVDDHLDGCESCRDVVSQVARVQAPAYVLPRGHAVGRYVIGDLLGSGAMGRVYSAWEPELDRRVAIKVLVAHGDDARARIVREAQAMAKLDHPNVVGVHEVGTSPDGVFVAMELVEGQTLRAWASSQQPSSQQPSTPRPWRQLATVLAEVAHGLEAVHAAGVTHRDIKPDNIIVGSDGRTRLGDFGLARSGVAAAVPPSSDDAVLATGTPVTAIAGTPAYMAPEVLRGGSATAASDQYSFGVMAYEVLAGHRPVTGTSWKELLAAIEANEVAPLRGVPGWLDEVVRRCLSVDPRRRFGSMREIATLIVARSVQRNPAWMLGGALAAAALASAATLLLVGGEAQRPAEPSCDQIATAEIEATWNVKASSRLATIGAPARAALDLWTRSWMNDRSATCRAAPTLVASKRVARERCFEQRRAELGALLARLEAPAPVVTSGSTVTGAEWPAAIAGDRVTDALMALPSPVECLVADAGMADPLPLDPALASIAREVEVALPTIRAANALGDSRPMLAMSSSVVVRARASGHAPTLAEALLVQAETLRGASQLVEAQVTARDALAAAERGHDDGTAARAWITRVAIAGDRRELALAEDFGAIAGAAIDRAGASPHLVGMLFKLRGLIAYNRGLFTEATQLLTEAHTRFTASAGALSLEVATIESALGSVARAAGDLDAAERWHTHALEIDRSLRAKIHPDIARDLHNIAGVLRLRGNLDGATSFYLQALAIEEASRGPRSVEAALTHNSLGLVALAQQDWPAARRELVLARDLLVAADHGDRAFAHHNLGLLEAAIGDHRLAFTHYERAAATYATTIGTKTAPAIRLLLDRARSQLLLDDAMGFDTAQKAIDAARTAGIHWIEQDAKQLLSNASGRKPRGTPTRPPTTPVEIDVEPPIRGVAAKEPAPAAVTPVPDPPAPQPKRDVGVYGSTQPW